MRVVQITPAFSVGDAVGENALAIHRYLRGQGVETFIMTPDIKSEHPAVKPIDFDFLKKLTPKDAVLYHIAVATPFASLIPELAAKKVIISHNVTPPAFYAEIAPEIAELLEKTLKELRFFVANQHRIDAFVGVSRYNTEQLRKMGAERCYTVPLVIDWSRFERGANPYFASLFQDDRVNLLFVGRIVPNKKIEDLIKFLFYYKEAISPRVRLVIAGNTKSLPRYSLALKDLAERFFLRSDEVVFTGWVEEDELIALYKTAHVFVSASEHEGFGVPFVEAMHFRLPIIAYDAAAVAETIGGGGVLMRTKRPDLWGEAIYELVTNRELREKIQQNQARRIEQLRAQRSEEKLFNLIKELCG